MLQKLLWIVALFGIIACGGGCPDDDPVDVYDWSVQIPNSISGPPGGSAAFDIAITRESILEFDLELSIESMTTGWTASISPVMITPTETPTQARVTVNIPSTATTGSVGQVRIRIRRTVDSIRFYEVPITVGNNAATSITKITDFTEDADGLFVSRFRVENGAPGPLIGSLIFQFHPEVFYWYRPDNVLNLGVNQSQDFEIVAVPRDSVNSAGNQTVSARFEKNGTIFSYDSTFNIPGNNDRGFRINAISSTLRNNLVGDTATYQITIDLPPGKAGVYTPSLARLHGSLSATFTPPEATFGAGGGSATFDLVITREYPDDANDYKTYEPVLVGTHASRSECNFRQVFPIFAAD
ncbi:MAG TPA: hypothetical protein PKA27_04320 [Fimbriimonadaceae bacterium]|nr:hypothetical protein [Fimbriimonadaceae bacterium]